jgi:hypothetical protein
MADAVGQVTGRDGRFLGMVHLRRKSRQLVEDLATAIPIQLAAPGDLLPDR